MDKDKGVTLDEHGILNMYFNGTFFDPKHNVEHSFRPVEILYNNGDKMV